MKNLQIETIKKEIENILKYYNYDVLENNLKTLKQELYQSESTKEKLSNEYRQKWQQARSEQKSIFNLKSDPAWKQFQEENEKQSEKQNEKSLILKNSIEAYENIINKILYDILIKILKIYLNNVKSTRDHNDFKRIFFDEKTKTTNFLIGFSYSGGYANRFNIFSRLYNNLESSYYIKYYIDMNNNIIYEEKEKELYIINYNNFIDFESYKNNYNIFDLNQLKKDIKKIIDLSNKENQKIKQQIKNSSDKIDNINIYNIRYFKELIK